MTNQNMFSCLLTQYKYCFDKHLKKIVYSLIYYNKTEFKFN